MGTRSLTRVFEAENDTEILCMYRQFDGYPTGHGKQLFEAFKDYGFCNGIGSAQSGCAKCGKQFYEHQLKGKRACKQYAPKKFCNGINCFAALLVKEMKVEIGGVYLYAPGTKDANQEYEYHFWLDGETGPLMLKVITPAWGKEKERVLYRGPLAQFNPEFCENFTQLAVGK